MSLSGVCNSQCMVTGAEWCYTHQVRPQLEKAKEQYDAEKQARQILADTIGDMLREKKQAKEQYDAILRERDEGARMLAAQTDLATSSEGQRARAIRERDAAREDAAKTREAAAQLDEWKRAAEAERDSLRQALEVRGCERGHGWHETGWCVRAGVPKNSEACPTCKALAEPAAPEGCDCPCHHGYEADYCAEPCPTCRYPKTPAEPAAPQPEESGR